MKHKFIIYFTFLLLVSSCKDDINYSSNPIPQIGFVSLSTDTVKSFKDSLIIKLSYQDGDGDLGDINADSLSISIRDIRFKNPDKMYLQPLAPINAGQISIKGKINIKINNLFLIGTGKLESTYFEIKIKDRSQNWSNLIFTPNVNIVR